MLRYLLLCLCPLLLVGCNLGWTLPEDTSPDLRLPTVTAAATYTPTPPTVTALPDGFYALQTFPQGLRDELPLMSGICFEAAWDTDEQVFVLRNALEHIRFYDLADRSRLCRNPVMRYPFDFEAGRILAGLWSQGQGCEAQHELLAVERDDPAQSITVRLRFTTSGACAYELLRPFWVSIPDAAGYDVRIEVER